jgi:type II secretory pathway component PulC
MNLPMTHAFTPILNRLFNGGSKGRIQKYAPLVLTWAIIVALCWILAHWTWVFVTPRQTDTFTSNHTAPSRLSIEPLLNAHVFGVLSHPSSAVAQATQLSTLNLKLHGVFAGAGKKWVAAIINIEQKDKAFKRGDEILPGVTLSSVYADYVELSLQGRIERLNLERPTGAPISPVLPNLPPPQGQYTLGNQPKM